MSPSYKKEKDNDYMILEVPGKPEGSEYQIRMLLLNSISGLLSCKMRKINGTPEFYYDITGRLPMTRAFERTLIKKEDIEKLLEGMERALDEAGRYLLDMGQFVLKPEYIFRDVEGGNFAFCYLPFYDGSLEEDFRELAEYILKRLDHSQEEAVLWGYDIYSRSMEEPFSLGKILESMHERVGKELAKQAAEAVKEDPEEEIFLVEEEEVSEEPEQKVEKKPVKKAEPKPETKTETKEAKKIRSRIKPKPERKMRSKVGQRILCFTAGMLLLLGVTAWAVKSQSLNSIQAGGILVLGMGFLVYMVVIFRKKPKKQEDRVEEMVMEWQMEDQDEKTIFLEQTFREEYPVVVSKEPDKRENIILNKPVLTVGKQRDQVDIPLLDQAVSRLHACFEKGEDGWYVRDCDSTNGTFVNGERLQAGEKRKLEEGAEIGLASYTFYFCWGGTTISSD